MFQCQRVESMSYPLANGRGELRLHHYARWNGALAGPEHNYRELSVELVADRRSDVHAVLLRKGYARSQDFAKPAHGELEVRSDPTQQRFWIVDNDARRILGTLDRPSGAVTGAEDATPTWATPDAGTTLKGIPVPSARSGGT